MARTNKTQFAVLGCLSIRPMSAYEIKHFMQGTTHYFWMEHEAQLYPTLSKLHDAKFVSCREEEAEKSGIRKIYKITAKGKSALTEWLIKSEEPVSYRNEFLLKLFFGDKVDTKFMRKKIETYAASLSQELHLFEHLIDELHSVKVSEKRRFFIEATIRYGIKSKQAEIAWCHETQAMLKKLK